MVFIRNIIRIIEILSLIIRYSVKEGRPGEKLARILESLGPVFIKLGQTLSTRPDIMGEEVCEDLAKLRDQLTPFEYEKVQRIIHSEHGHSVQELYEQFDPRPVAAASIAQVHKAKLKNGKDVAVKILRPGIEKVFAKDIALFYFLSEFLDIFFPKYKRLKFRKVVQTLEDSTNIELDLRFEAAAASELKENMKNDSTIYVPEVYWDLTSKKVLTIEWIDAIRIDDKEALLAKGHDLHKVAANLAVSFFNQAYRDGFFHADVHPGNLFVNDLGQIVVVDFGIMGRIDKKNRIFVAEILYGFIKRDYKKVAQVHFDAGYVPRTQSVEQFTLAMRSVGEKVVGIPAHRLSLAKLLAQLFKITADFNMQTQEQLLLLQKTMMLVEGVGMKLDNKVNLWLLAEPWMEEWAIKNIGPEAKFMDFIQETLAALRHLPERLQERPDQVVIVKRDRAWLISVIAAAITSLAIIYIVK